MRTTETIAALDQIEAPAIQVAEGIYDIAPKREEVESQANRKFTTPTISVTKVEMENTLASDAGEFGRRYIMQVIGAFKDIILIT